MSKPPAFMFYPDDYLSDPNVVAMTPEARGAYWHLCCFAWKNGPIGQLRNDDRQLAALSGLGERRWEKCKASILAAFDTNDDYIVQKRLVREREKQVAFREKQQRSGIASGEARRAKRIKTNHRSTTLERPLNDP